jgi:hypothetical protein
VVRALVRRPFDVALAATLHDPPGALLDELRSGLPRLASLYRGVAVATSPPTSARVNRLLADAGMRAGTPSGNHRGPLYRLSIRAALASGAGRVHYLDLDRALHWLRRAPRELAAALRAARRQRVLVLGRTAKAHRSHHVPLYATETLANRLLGARLAVAGRVDLLVPSFVLERDLAVTLLSRSRTRDAAIYGELAALVMHASREVAYLECRGLDWETPDRHRRAVRRSGLPAWRRRHDTPAEWSLRVDLAQAFIQGFDHTQKRFPMDPPLVRRLPPRIG